MFVEKEFSPSHLPAVKFAGEYEVTESFSHTRFDIFVLHLGVVDGAVQVAEGRARWCTYDPVRVVMVNDFESVSPVRWFGEVPICAVGSQGAEVEDLQATDVQISSLFVSRLHNSPSPVNLVEGTWRYAR